MASRDPNFLRLASAVLSRAGHGVHTTTDRTTRVQRLVRLRTPQVLVIEAAEGAASQVRAMVAGIGISLGVVLVSDEARHYVNGLRGPGDMPVVAKWGSPDALVYAVELAAASVPADAQSRAADAPRSHLRLV